MLISGMWAFVFACILTFWEHTKVGSLLLLPYLLWLSYATALNTSILCLNNGCNVNI